MHLPYRVSLVLTGLQRACYDQLVERPPHSRPRRLAWPRTSPFHGGNTGSNPVGDASLEPTSDHPYDCQCRVVGLMPFGEVIHRIEAQIHEVSRVLRASCGDGCFQ